MFIDSCSPFTFCKEVLLESFTANYDILMQLTVFAGMIHMCKSWISVRRTLLQVVREMQNKSHYYSKF